MPAVFHTRRRSRSPHAFAMVAVAFWSHSRKSELRTFDIWYHPDWHTDAARWTITRACCRRKQDRAIEGAGERTPGSISMMASG